MPRENAQDKGRRYLVEGRLTIVRVAGRQIRAVCKGDSGEVYSLGYDPGAWHCNCPARGRCAHLTALMLTTNVPGTWTVAPDLMVATEVHENGSSQQQARAGAA